MLNAESKLAGHLLDDIQLNGGRILLVVDGEEGYASLMLGNDGIGRDDTGTAGLASPLGCNGHTNLADAWTEFGSLKGILFKRLQKVLVVISHAAITLGEAFDRDIKVFVPRDFVTHRLTHLLDGTYPTSLFLNTLSSLSWPGKSLQLRRAWVLQPSPHPKRASGGHCHDVISARRALRAKPYPQTWSDWLGNLLYLQWSYSSILIS